MNSLRTLQPSTPRRLSSWLLILAFLFTGLAQIQLGLVNNNLGFVTTLAPLLVLVLCGGTAAYVLFVRMQYPPVEPILLPLTFFLSGLGLALISRLAPLFVNRQLFWLVIATAVLLLINLVPKNLDWLRRYKYTWLIGGIAVLASTLIFGVNPSGFGARLWLQIGNFFFQPSELLKLLLVVFLAAYLADRRYQLVKVPANIGGLSIPHPSYLGPMLLMWGFSMILLIWQRDLGAALLFFGTFLGMLYAATGQRRYIWAGALLLLVGGVIGYYLFDVVRIRVDGFLNPWLDPSGRSFQIVQSLLAFASGGFFGQGLGQGLPTAIPVVHTDFVYAAIGEEYGLLGALGVLVCFALLVERAFSIAQRAVDDFERLLAVGIGTMLALQTLVITAGALKLMPLTGVTLPFVSYGGSSLVMSFVMVGLLLFIAKQPPTKSDKRPSAFQIPTYNFQLAKILFTGFIIVAGGLILWQIVAPPLLVNREDNPRQVIAEQRIDRGRLLTRDGVPIAETIIGPDGVAQRRYPYPGLSSVTGYYSIRYGVGGTEATFDAILRGTAGRTDVERMTDDLLHRPLIGQDVTLTIDLPAQVAADVALGNQEGAVVVMDIETGAILVMSSHPTYDPNTLDETWDTLRLDERAPLVNRTTQGLFPVGTLGRFIGLIGLYEAGAAVPDDALNVAPETLVAPLGPTGFNGTAAQLALNRPLPGLRSQAGRLPDFEDQETVKDLAISPLHLVRIVAALERDGQLPTPILSLISPTESTPGFSPRTAQAVRGRLPQMNDRIIGLAGQASPEETGQRFLSWFVGLAPTSASPPPTGGGATAGSAALADGDLILDPSKIEAGSPTPTPVATREEKARYAVVAVVVTDAPAEQLAFRIARAPLNTLLDSSLD